ncbi:hypothetical protein Nepgr_026092 [Nepenthes gracilis]|uniref:Uncharacterized protein n=1 Tax=Nepenthes gracilis TaxID=150966 RepID=A0AAD3T7Q8_NEPGR|nr:hypothetical protein Nepgr_026092 [Nepenthes gracilis]
MIKTALLWELKYPPPMHLQLSKRPTPSTCTTLQGGDKSDTSIDASALLASLQEGNKVCPSNCPSANVSVSDPSSCKQRRLPFIETSTATDTNITASSDFDMQPPVTSTDHDLLVGRPKDIQVSAATVQEMDSRSWKQ